jgi:death-on-curing protein
MMQEDVRGELSLEDFAQAVNLSVWRLAHIFKSDVGMPPMQYLRLLRMELLKVKFPNKLDVLMVHATLIAETGGISGLRDEGLFESALDAAENRHHYEAADVVSCAAAYAYHLTQAHAFIDGNNCIGAAITETFLETNGFKLAMTNEEIIDLFLAIASSELSRDQVEQQLREKVLPKQTGGDE